MRRLLLISLLLLVCASQCFGAFSRACVFPLTSNLASCVDYDKDGRPDLIIGRSIHHNRGDGTFEAIGTVPSAPDPNGESIGPTAWVDFDGDGVRDVLVFGNGPRHWVDPMAGNAPHPADRIFYVTGYTSGSPALGSYLDIEGWDVPATDQLRPEALMTNQNATFGVAVADINRDGRPDLYLGRGRIGDMGWTGEIYGKDMLVKNLSVLGAIAMADISNDVGLTRANQYCTHSQAASQFRNTDGVGVADYNFDGYPDFFAAPYRCKCNAFWKGGPGSRHGYVITNPTDQDNLQLSTGLNLSNVQMNEALHGCGVHWLDFDNDGDLDLFESRFSHFVLVGALRLSRNRGDGTFEDASNLIPQLLGRSWVQHYRGITVGDYDNDGDIDIYVGRNEDRPAPSVEELRLDTRGRLLRNNLMETGSPGFIEVTESENLYNGSHSDNWGSAFLDYNGDGKLDLFTTQSNMAVGAQPELWRNDGAWTGHWLFVDLLPPREVNGVRINRDGIGAVVQIWVDKDQDGSMEAGELITRQQMGHSTGNLWQGPMPLHFGLGQCVPSKGRVYWPGAIGADAKPIWIDFDIPGVDRTIIVSASLPPSGIPGIPRASALFSGSSVTFSWDAADDLGSGVAGYNCEVGTLPGAADVFSGNVGAVLSKTFQGVDGATYYCRVAAVDGQGRVGAWSPSSDGVTVDSSLPVGHISINAGKYATSSTSATVTLSVSDATSGLAKMKSSLDGVNWSPWRACAPSEPWPLSLGDGEKRVWFEFVDLAGNSAVFQDSIILDQTVPVPGQAAVPASADALPITVSYTGAADAVSGLKQVELWYKKTSDGIWKKSASPVQTGASGAFAFSEVLGQGEYRFALVAEDNAGNRSAAATADGMGGTNFTGYTPCTLGVAKHLPAGTPVIVVGVVAAVFGDCIYIESADRSAGVRVEGKTSARGRMVEVFGALAPAPSLECVLWAESLDDKGSGTVLPLGMNSSAIGGAAFGVQTSVGGAGLNNVGLLVRTFGRVTARSETTVTIDGSLEVILPSGVSAPAQGAFAAMTGVVSCIPDGSGAARPVVLATSVSAY